MASKGKLPAKYRARQSDSTDVEEYFRALQSPSLPSESRSGEPAVLQIVRRQEEVGESCIPDLSMDETSMDSRTMHARGTDDERSREVTGSAGKPSQLSTDVSSMDVSTADVSSMAEASAARIAHVLPPRGPMAAQQAVPLISKPADSSKDVSSGDKTSRDVISSDEAAGGLDVKLGAARLRTLAQGRSPLEISELWISLVSGKVFHGSKVRWVSIAQQSMTPGQERFYETIWRSKGDYYFQIDTLSRHVKRFSAGYEMLSRICRLASRNVRIIIPVLAQKQILFSYKDYRPELRKGTTYDIFSYEEILRRQRAAGLCYVVKSGPGIDFVLPHSWVASIAATPRDISAVDEISEDEAPMDEFRPDESSAYESTRADMTSRDPLDDTSRPSLDDTSTPLDRDNSSSQSTTVRRLLQTLLPTFDNDAVSQLWEDCRRRIPDVSPEEVAQLFEYKLPESRARSITRPIGFLISAVARSCTPAAIGALRQGREVASEIPILVPNNELEEMLADPNTSPEMRRLVEERLRDRR